jgi:hypothetical protein
MSPFKTPIFLGVALLLASTCAPAHAYLYLGGDEVLNTLGMNYYEQQEQQNAPARQATQYREVAAAKTVDRSGANAQLGPVQASLPSQMQVLGYYVGNLQFKVGSMDDTLYLITPKGEYSALPPGTQAQNVAVPFNNAFVQGIMNGQPVASQESQLRSNTQKNGGSGRYVSSSAVLTPTVMSTRTMVVNGQPMVVGGPIISELRVPTNAMPPQVQRTSYTQARVIPGKKAAKRFKARKTSK